MRWDAEAWSARLAGGRQSEYWGDSRADHHENIITVTLSHCLLCPKPAVRMSLFSHKINLDLSSFLVQVRSKIGRGSCDQPKAGCMGPVVSNDRVIPRPRTYYNLLQGLGRRVGQSGPEVGRPVCWRWLQGRLQAPGPHPLPRHQPQQEDW